MAAQRIAAASHNIRTNGASETQVMTVSLTDGTSHSASVTNNVVSDWCVIEEFPVFSISVVNGASNGCTFTVEGSVDETNFVTLAYRDLSDSTRAFATTGLAVGAGAKKIIAVSRDDHIRFLRVNVSAANSNGCTFTVAGRSV